MKRILSLILVLVLALGSVPFAFADDAMTAGETLQELGLAKGVDAEGNLNEEGMLTRAEMMVVISRLLGVEEEAMNYAIPSTSKDVEGHWAAKYIAYAEQVGKWSNGVGNDMFAPQGQVTNQMVAKFMLTALGYEANWETAVQDATALGLMEGVSGEATANITRGNVFKAALNTINTPMKDSDVKLGVSLGVLEEEVTPVAELTGKFDTVKAVGNTLVEIEFEEAIDVDAAAAAAYVIVEKADAAKTIAVNKVNVESDTVVTLETEALTSGTAYKLSVADLEDFFTGIAKDSDDPKVTSVRGSDTDLVDVKFDKVMDKATAEDIANYSIDKVGTVVKAELKSDRKTVTLTTEGFEKVAAHKLTVENVLSVDGEKVDKTTRTFYPIFDKTGAKIDAVKNVNTQNNVELYVYFKDAHGVNKEAAEDISNYSIDGLEIISAKAAKKELVNNAAADSDYYKRVTLVTSEQKANTRYTLEVTNMVDGSTAMNVTEKDSDIFYGGRADTKAPTLLDTKALSLNLIKVVFNETNKLDPATALDISNYTFDKDALTVLEAKFEDDDTDSKVIHLTVSTMENSKNYRLNVNNVSDNFGNSISDKITDSVFVKITEAAPTISTVVSTGADTVEVTFDESVTSSAEEATNYVLNNGVGSPLTAEFKSGSDTVVVLTFEELTANKKYELTVDNVENYSEYVMDAVSKTFIVTRTSADTDEPEVEYVDLINGVLRIEFSEDIRFDAGAKMKYKIGEDATVHEIAVDAVTNDSILLIEFDDANAYDDKNVIIVGFTGVTDIARNAVDYTDGDFEFATGSAYDAATDSIEVIGIVQDSARVIRMYFSDAVEVATSTITLNSVDFDIEVDEDDDTSVLFTADTVIADEKEFVFLVDTHITDLVGRDTRDYDTSSDDRKVVTFETFIKDEDAPILLNVIAVDNKTVELTYDEDLASTDKGTYTIKNEDGTTFDGSPSVSLDGNVVTLTTRTLASDKFYTLFQNVLAKDLSGNKAEEVKDGFEFIGSDVKPANDTLDGVALINGTILEIKDGSNLKAGTYTVTGSGITGAATSVTVAADTTKTAVITLATGQFFTEGVEYTLTAPAGYENNVIKFDGIYVAP